MKSTSYVKWLEEASCNLGVKEIPGPLHNEKISMWLHKLNAWWIDDETPWCGVFVAHCIQSAGWLALPKYWMRAKAWAEWGVPLKTPSYGCIVVFNRKGGGHVGFVVGKKDNGNLFVLGGNQNNEVNIKEFNTENVIAYRLPYGRVPVYPLPVLSNNETIKTDVSLV